MNTWSQEVHEIVREKISDENGIKIVQVRNPQSILNRYIENNIRECVLHVLLVFIML